MDKKYITKTIPAILLSISMVLCQGLIKTSHASAKITPVILLSDYQREMKIGEEYSLFAYSSDGRIPKFSSSDKKIATVDQYGKIIAKKAGKCTIIVKAFTTEAYCRLEVLKTQITLSSKSISIENNETYYYENDIKRHITNIVSQDRLKWLAENCGFDKILNEVASLIDFVGDISYENIIESYTNRIVVYAKELLSYWREQEEKRKVEEEHKRLEEERKKRN